MPFIFQQFLLNSFTQAQWNSKRFSIYHKWRLVGIHLVNQCKARTLWLALRTAKLLKSDLFYIPCLYLPTLLLLITLVFLYRHIYLKKKKINSYNFHPPNQLSIRNSRISIFSLFFPTTSCCIQKLFL